MTCSQNVDDANDGGDVDENDTNTNDSNGDDANACGDVDENHANTNDSNGDDANACLCIGSEYSSPGIPPVQGEGCCGEAEKLRVSTRGRRLDHPNAIRNTTIPM